MPCELLSFNRIRIAGTDIAADRSAIATLSMDSGSNVSLEPESGGGVNGGEGAMC